MDRAARSLNSPLETAARPLRVIGYRQVLAGRRSDREHRLGHYRTPDLTASYMARQVLPALRGGGLCLDPAAGSGVFLQALRDLGADPAQLRAVDLDPQALPHLRGLAGRAECRDFLLEDDGTRYRAILGNPPYLSHECDYIRRNRPALEKRYGRPFLGNLYCLFTLAALERLEPGGLLCFLLLDSFLTTTSYRAFRRRLLEESELVEVLLVPRSLFRGQSADVRTAILTLRKRRPDQSPEDLCRNEVRVAGRLLTEQEYLTAPRLTVRQGEWASDPEARFLVGVPPELSRAVVKARTRVGELFEGGAGISTGSDRRYLRPLAEVAGHSGWVPFMKNPSRRFHCPPELAIRRDWQALERSSRTFIARNRSCYLRPGIACSSMGVPFRACYLPAGCLFGVNTNLFHEDEAMLYAGLAYLNSSLAEYWVRAVLNRTNMVTARYVKSLPWPALSPPALAALSEEARSATDRLSRREPVDLGRVRDRIDRIVFDAFGWSGPEHQALREHVRDFCAHLRDRL